MFGSFIYIWPEASLGFGDQQKELLEVSEEFLDTAGSRCLLTGVTVFISQDNKSKKAQGGAPGGHRLLLDPRSVLFWSKLPQPWEQVMLTCSGNWLVPQPGPPPTPVEMMRSFMCTQKEFTFRMSPHT